jgi:hypothetical protein
MDVDFMKLGSGTTIECQVWVANVKMAISIAKIVHGNFCTQKTLQVLHTPQLKPSSNLPYKQTPNCPPSKQTGPTALKLGGPVGPLPPIFFSENSSLADLRKFWWCYGQMALPESRLADF